MMIYFSMFQHLVKAKALLFCFGGTIMPKAPSLPTIPLALITTYRGKHFTPTHHYWMLRTYLPQKTHPSQQYIIGSPPKRIISNRDGIFRSSFHVVAWVFFVEARESVNSVQVYSCVRFLTRRIPRGHVRRLKEVCLHFEVADTEWLVRIVNKKLESLERFCETSFQRMF